MAKPNRESERRRKKRRRKETERLLLTHNAKLDKFIN